VVDNTPVWVYLLSAVLSSGLLSALVSWRVSLAVGNRQAKATVDAARVQAESHLQAAKHDAEAMMQSAREQAQASYDAAIDHAIRGEKLKLRASIMQRRLAAFNEAISELLSAFSGTGSAAPLAARLHGISWRIAHNAVLTSGPNEEKMVREVVNPFISRCRGLEHHADRAVDIGELRSSNDYRELMEGIEGLSRVVDWAAEKRIEQSAHLPVPGAYLLPPEGCDKGPPA